MQPLLGSANDDASMDNFRNHPEEPRLDIQPDYTAENIEYPMTGIFQGEANRKSHEDDLGKYLLRALFLLSHHDTIVDAFRDCYETGTVDLSSITLPSIPIKAAMRSSARRSG